MDDAWFEARLHELDEASRHESDDICYIVSQIVPTYKYQRKEKETYV